MANFTNLIIQALKMLVKARKVGDYKNMSRQQLETIFIMISVLTPLPRPVQISKKATSISAPVAAPKHKKVHLNMA